MKTSQFFAPLLSITSSARASSAGGTSRKVRWLLALEDAIGSSPPPTRIGTHQQCGTVRFPAAQRRDERCSKVNKRDASAWVSRAYPFDATNVRNARFCSHPLIASPLPLLLKVSFWKNAAISIAMWRPSFLLLR
jgi:hypothetical protein